MTVDLGENKQTLLNFLQGRLPDGCELEHLLTEPPHLEEQQAWQIVEYVQNMEDLETAGYVDEFYMFLMGKDMVGGSLNEFVVKLDSDQAYGIIYFMQEQLRIVPDHFERCDFCKELFDSEDQGETSKALVGHYLTKYGESSGVEIPPSIWRDVENKHDGNIFCESHSDNQGLEIGRDVYEFLNRELKQEVEFLG
jgi:hypothetical protein